MAECKYVDCPSVDLVKSVKLIEEKVSNYKAMEVDICYIRKMVDKNEYRTEHDLEEMKKDFHEFKATHTVLMNNLTTGQSEFLTKKDVKLGIAVVAIVVAIVTEAIHLLIKTIIV